MVLRKKGIKTTDIIMVCCQQHAEQTVVVLGILFAGAVIAPINHDISHEECMTFLTAFKPKIIFCDLRTVGQFERVQSELGRAKSGELVVFGSTDAASSFNNFLAHKPDSDFEATKIPNPKETVAFVVHTQGTSGVPKLVCTSHYSIFKQTQQYFGFLSNMKRMMSFFPLSNIIQAVLVCACFEAPVVRILPGEFSERSVCNAFHDLRIDHAFLTVDLAVKISNHPALQVKGNYFFVYQTDESIAIHF